MIKALKRTQLEMQKLLAQYFMGWAFHLIPNDHEFKVLYAKFMVENLHKFK